MRKVFILSMCLSLLFTSPAFASSVGVHMHNMPSTTQTSEGVVADVADPDSSDEITSIIVDGYLQSGDRAWIVWQTYSQWEQDPGNKTNTIGAQEVTNESFPFTSNWSYFRCWIEVETAATSTDCTLLYFTETTNSNNVTTTFSPITCDSGSDPPDDPPPPPELPAPPSIPGSPTFNVTNPSMPSGSVNIPSSGYFDGSYDYQEPEREGAFTYEPEPLNVPEPIPSPPPPPEGPGLFNFQDIMQSIGAAEQPSVIDNPSEKEAPINKETQQSVENPVISEQPLQKNEQEQITPALQMDTPLSIQPAVVQPALMDDVITKDTPLQLEGPLSIE